MTSSNQPRGFERFISKKERLPPFLKNDLLGANGAVPDNVNFTACRAFRLSFHLIHENCVWFF